MKISARVIAVGLTVLLSSAVQAELSANIGATSNYVWRGLTQTDDGPAISGGIDYADDSGFYLGTWASNVDGGDDGSGSELDFYGGYEGSAGDFGYDMGVIHYMYPSFNDWDFTEIYGSISWNWLEAGVAYTIQKEAEGDENDIYYYVAGSYEFMPTWSAGVTIGHYDWADSGSEDYSHAQLDITKSAGDFGDFTMSFSKTDDYDDEAEDDDDWRIFVSWVKSF